MPLHALLVYFPFLAICSRCLLLFVVVVVVVVVVVLVAVVVVVVLGAAAVVVVDAAVLALPAFSPLSRFHDALPADS